MIKLGELPYEQFQMLGVKKRDLLNLPPRTLNALLNGQRTSLIRFNNVAIPGLEGAKRLDAKMSIDLKPDGTPNLKVYPINKTATNTFNLNAEKIAWLEKANTNFVESTIKLPDGSLTNVMIYLDRMTNDYIAINKASIRAPEEINDTALSNEQKEDFKNGKPIHVDGEEFIINPNSEIGVSSTEGNDLNISKIRFKQTTYSKKELAIDLALLASGPGNMVLLEHLANIALYTAPERITNNDSIFNISNPSYWEAINDASNDIMKLNEDEKYNSVRIVEIVNQHLEKIGIIYRTDALASKNIAGEDGKKVDEYTLKASPTNKIVAPKKTGRKSKV